MKSENGLNIAPEIALFSLVVGDLKTNCYILGDRETGEAVIIDPGADPDLIDSLLRENGLKPVLIVNTHGHYDHIGANSYFEVPIYIHALDAPCLEDPGRNLSEFLGNPCVCRPAAGLLKDGDTVRSGRISLRVIHTPGHTPGGICLKTGDIIFTGDTLFRQGIGRTDLPLSSERELLRAIKEKLMVFSDETVIYPGHGPSSTIGEERRMNLFLL